MPELEFQSLTVRFGSGRRSVTAVDTVDLRIPSGTIMGLVGESGSGKSTIARAAVGLHEPSGGRILLDGEDVAHARSKSLVERRRRIQMIFQDPYSCLDPRMTIGESIGEALATTDRRAKRSRGAAMTTSAARRERTAELLAMVQLDPARAASLPTALSGGQRQRVAIARALAAEPEVLLADEITSALDVSVQGSVLNLLTEVQKRLSLTVLFISHNLAVVRQIADEIAVMHQGVIVETGTALDVLERPQHSYTQNLIGAVPRVGVPLDSSTVPAE
jgi:peptide/nickel transport system ATP-binding protein